MFTMMFALTLAAAEQAPMPPQVPIMDPVSRQRIRIADRAKQIGDAIRKRRAELCPSNCDCGCQEGGECTCRHNHRKISVKSSGGTRSTAVPVRQRTTTPAFLGGARGGSCRG